METQFTNPLPTIDIHKRKQSAFNTFKKIVLLVLGIAGIIFSCFLVFTIVFFPFAMIIFAASIGCFVFIGDRYLVACPNCKKKMVVKKNQEDFKCKRCEQPTIINWIK